MGLDPLDVAEKYHGAWEHGSSEVPCGVSRRKAALGSGGKENRGNTRARVYCRVLSGLARIRKLILMVLESCWEFREKVSYIKMYIFKD